MILVGALAALLGLGIAAWIGFAELTMPVLRLCGRMAQLAGGDLDTPVEGQGRHDEIGRMARAVQVFKENAHARRLAEAEAEQARSAAAQATRDAQADIARVARVLSVGELASSIAHEINQPIGAIAVNGRPACAGWSARRQTSTGPEAPSSAPSATRNGPAPSSRGCAGCWPRPSRSSRPWTLTR